MGVFQLIANIKHRKQNNCSGQPLPLYNQPFKISLHVRRSNPLLVYASIINPRHSNITAVQPLTFDNGKMPRTAGHNRSTERISVTTDTKTTWQLLSTTDRSIFLHGPWFYSTHSLFITLRKFKSHRLQRWLQVCVCVCVRACVCACVYVVQQI
jgi:hypothetical protein